MIYLANLAHKLDLLNLKTDGNEIIDSKMSVRIPTLDQADMLQNKLPIDWRKFVIVAVNLMLCLKMFPYEKFYIRLLTNYIKQHANLIMSHAKSM